MSNDDITIPMSNVTARHNYAWSYKSRAIEHIANSEVAMAAF